MNGRYISTSNYSSQNYIFTELGDRHFLWFLTLIVGDMVGLCWINGILPKHHSDIDPEDYFPSELGSSEDVMGHLI